jgi:hypothetical protein
MKSEAIEGLKQYHASEKIMVSNYHYIAKPPAPTPIPKPDPLAAAQRQIAESFLGISQVLKHLGD